MAHDARQPRPDLTEGAAPAETFDFFELLRRLEREGKLFGHAGAPTNEPARLGQHIRLGFAVKDVAEFRPAAGGPPRVTIANIGLLGPEGPLPIHITRWVLDRLSQRWFAGSEQRETSDTTFMDFANILQHRMIALFYRAWADNHLEVQVERARGSGLRGMLAAMAGIGLPGMAGGATEVVRLRQAASLANQVDAPERLTGFLAEAFRVPVALKEFIATWTPIPASLQTRLGKAFGALGRGATIGPRVFSRQDRIELQLGPLDWQTFESFLPGTEKLEALRTAARDLVGGTLDVDLRLVLRAADVPRGRLGRAQLGRTGWLASNARDRDCGDLLLRTFIGWRPAAEAAA